jgi:hypothetical protein
MGVPSATMIFEIGTSVLLTVATDCDDTAPDQYKLFELSDRKYDPEDGAAEGSVYIVDPAFVAGLNPT